MRVLLIHADRFSFRVTGETSVAMPNELQKASREGEVGESLVVFIAAEKGDEADVDSVVNQVLKEILSLADQVGTDHLVLYPYAHLSSRLSSPRVAVQLFDKLCQQLQSHDQFKILRAPFGYYKAFEIACKGHPLSELAKTITPSRSEAKSTEGVEESQALRAEKALKSEWIIMTPEGEQVSAEDYSFVTRPTLKQLYRYEKSGTRVSDQAPPHIELMRRMELVDYEPGADPGNFRWYPKGQLMKRLAETYVSGLVIAHGGMQVETPIMYDYQHPGLNLYLQRFPARQYVLLSGQKEYFLRFAACFGQYLIQHDMQISYHHLPSKLYELTHYAFRREQSGELAGLKRLRTFTMPDLHTLVKDVEQAKEEFLRQTDLAIQCMEGFELDYEVAIRFVRNFADQNKPFVERLASCCGRPALMELWDERSFYFVAKLEFNFIDALNKAACLSTVQIDVENTERFDITYVDKNGEKQHPLLLHASISGSIDRLVYAILETQSMRMSKGQKAEFPFWLAPIQLRLVPVSEKFDDACKRVLENVPYRIDYDDRNITMGRKIRDAEKEWIPYILVLGAKEVADQCLNVRTRDGAQRKMPLSELLAEIEPRMKGKPYLDLSLPRCLSQRPIFVG
ncbi:MAG: threonine--tRNA ligase [Desulfobacterales bacterium C00003060]|nr:MAG: threonine--tRNA ligase [Desulfobacterales bacterium S3730MH5]OEU77212.1 MAG: threonine--tRNA ligase [Desulfobacterales bacterium C00003060]OEU84682.1 MAG: threonine--tRNA ligase [Desulfobacterales bacterium S5133MH4]